MTQWKPTPWIAAVLGLFLTPLGMLYVRGSSRVLPRASRVTADRSDRCDRAAHAVGGRGGIKKTEFLPGGLPGVGDTTRIRRNKAISGRRAMQGFHVLAPCHQSFEKALGFKGV
jgi:hypothetical protein